jgi:hypothetical protein
MSINIITEPDFSQSTEAQVKSIVDHDVNSLPNVYTSQPHQILNDISHILAGEETPQWEDEIFKRNNLGSPFMGQVLTITEDISAAWSYVTDASIDGNISVAHGGTGVATLTAGNLLVGNGTDPIESTLAAPTSAVVGIDDIQTLTNKTLVGGSNGNNVTANILAGINITGTPSAGQALIASSETDAEWGPIAVSGTLGVANGGTGAATLSAGNFLIGNGTSAVNTAKVAPSGVVVGTTDAQTLTNKSIIGGAGGNDITANKLPGGVTVSSSVPSVGQLLMYDGSSWAPTTYLAIAPSWTVKDVKSTGTAGDTITAAQWNTRTLNTLTGSSDTSITLASNRITFTAGTYRISVKAPAFQVARHKCRLYNVTDTVAIIVGSNVTSPLNLLSLDTMSYSSIDELVSFTSTKVVEVQTWSTTTGTGGLAFNAASAFEIYTIVTVQKA